MTKLIEQVDLRVYHDLHELSNELVKDFSTLHQSLVKKFYILPGGNTPKLFYERLARTVSDWDNTTIMLSDERNVKESDEESNSKMLKSYLFENIPQNVLPSLLPYPIPDSGFSLTAANKKLKKYFNTSSISLSLLGLGSDGHFASLFPPVTKKYFSSGPLISTTKKGEKITRISLTYDIFLRSKQLWFVLTGTDKASVLNEILMGKANAVSYPAYKLINIYRESRIRIYCDKNSVKLL